MRDSWRCISDATKAGVITGDNVRKVFEYAREHQVCLSDLISRI